MRVVATWDSGPYSEYYAAPEGADGRNVFEVEESLFREYQQAEKAFRDAETKLSEAYEAVQLRR